MPAVFLVLNSCALEFFACRMPPIDFWSKLLSFHFPASYCFKSMLCNNGEALWGVNSVKKNVCTLIKAAYSWNFGHRQFLLSKVHAMRGDFNLLIIFLIFFFWKNMAKKHVILCKTLFLIFGVFCCSTLAFNFLF